MVKKNKIYFTNTYIYIVKKKVTIDKIKIIVYKIVFLVEFFLFDFCICHLSHVIVYIN